MARYGLGCGLVVAALLLGFESLIGASDATTPLIEAIRQNNVATVDALIKQGTDVTSATRYGITPLGLAALNSNAAIARKLLDAGADPNAATPGGETALMT